MEIIPGEGVALAKVGEHRDEVESRIGRPKRPGRRSKVLYGTDPMLVLSYLDDETVELVELSHSGGTGEEVFFDGVQLTWRFMDDVVADLAAKGYRAEPSDIGFVFEPGFAIFSIGSRSPQELNPEVADDDERVICEGVSVAPHKYFFYDPADPDGF